MLYMVQKTEYRGYECDGVETFHSFHNTLEKAKEVRLKLLEEHGGLDYYHWIIAIDENGNMESVRDSL